MFIAKAIKLIYVENENTHVIRYAREVREFIRDTDIARITQATISIDRENALNLLLEHVGECLHAYHFMTWAHASLDDFRIKYTITEVIDGKFDDYMLTSTTNVCNEYVSLGGKPE